MGSPIRITGMNSGLDTVNSTDSIGSGLQVGLVNATLEMTGVQIGIVNYTDFMVGFQIGIVNIIRESIVPFFPIVNFCF